VQANPDPQGPRWAALSLVGKDVWEGANARDLHAELVKRGEVVLARRTRQDTLLLRPGGEHAAVVADVTEGLEVRLEAAVVLARTWGNDVLRDLMDDLVPPALERLYALLVKEAGRTA